MLVAVCGSQGSGKSTVLNEIKSRGYPVIERKTSRSILSDWGVTLSEVNNNHDLTVKFQEEILARKCADEQEALASTALWFTERSFADLFTYALVSLGKDNEYSEWLNRYFDACLYAQQLYYSTVFYIPGGMFNVEHDGVRGSNHYYSTMVDLTMRHFSNRMGPVTEVNKLSVDDRADEIIFYAHKVSGVPIP